MPLAKLDILFVCLNMEPPDALPFAVTCNRSVKAFMAMQIFPADDLFEACFNANNLNMDCNRFNSCSVQRHAHGDAQQTTLNSCSMTCCARDDRFSSRQGSPATKV